MPDPRDLTRVIAALRREAEELTEIARQLRASGLPGVQVIEERIRVATEMAARMEALTVPTHSANVQAVTDVEKRRARAVAKARAVKSKDKRREAIAARWGSQAKAAKAAGISPAALVGYLKGEYPVPRKVARVLSADPALPANEETWPAGIVD